LAVDAAGNAAVIWLHRSNEVRGVLRSPSGIFTPVRTLSSAEADAWYPRVAITADGNAVFAWARTPSGTGSRPSRVETRELTAANVLSPIRAVWDGIHLVFDVRVVTDTTGNAIYGWIRGGFDYVRVQTRTRSAGAVFGPVQNVSSYPPGRSYGSFRMATDSSDNVIFFWSRMDHESSNPYRFFLQTRARSAAGTLGPLHTFPDQPQTSGPDIALGAATDAIAVVSGYEGPVHRRRVWGYVGP
jgi:hypothetical protein